MKKFSQNFREIFHRNFLKILKLYLHCGTAYFMCLESYSKKSIRQQKNPKRASENNLKVASFKCILLQCAQFSRKRFMESFLCLDAAFFRITF